MAPDVKTVVENSRIYQAVATMWRAGEGSLAVRLLNDQRVLLAGVVLFVLISLLRILVSGLHVTVKFLSFALLAVVLLVLVWPYTKPLADS